MNQTIARVQISLLDLTEYNSRPFGNVEGKAVFRRLVEIIDTYTQPTIFEISLSGVEATDASFPRESVINAAKLYHHQHWFYLTDLDDRDLIDNWKYACQAKEQPLVIWHGDSFEPIGPDMSSSSRELLSYVLEHKCVLASQVAADLDLSVQNASTRLKRLVADGYILRTEDIASTGGIEYQYRAIR
ncbi:MarR family transcriptional regulator [Burkholderia vietnamiensis]|uniref:DNA-binding protein n=1 Tax=Burkholderia vietnamiensis (strain G4 / LMG 22486) TaxID=269482 RepID=A4JAI2_BURVG|nr:helix-turn-helix domain-containing protein [Burkholderia vietnamiensis]ABO53285.1 conserved hypothetical protein [Burkholderia vietnamiensis G4]MCB4346321.1 MarR family transcriptional regulator [Burkholderia vietnamiensis]